MIKRILLLTLAYAALTVIITLTLSQHQSFVAILLVLNSVFAVLILITLFKNFRLSKQNMNTNHHSQYKIPDDRNNFKTDAWFKISQKPFLAGLEKRLISSQDFYYDQSFFYAIDEAGNGSKYPLTDIAELSGTGTQINNNRIWQVKIFKGSEMIEYRFAHNFSIWNKNFLNFYKRVKQISPQAVKSKWSLWRM